MAWFGEGLSSLKGQITNFTKEIVATNVVGLGLNDDTSCPEDSSTSQCADAKATHIEQLKINCKNQDEEIAKLKEENEKLRGRLVRQPPRDRRISEEATLECEEGTHAGAAPPLPLVPLDDAGTDSFLGQDQVPKDVRTEDEISSLRSRLRKTFQEKVLMEQSCSRLEKEVALLTQQVVETQANTGTWRGSDGVCRDCHRGTQTEGSVSQAPNSPDVTALMQENDRLKQERGQLRVELARMSRAVQDLESQVAVSQDENANLSTGMEELDIQHQEAIEQIMVLKDSTQKRYEVLLAEFEDMQYKYEEMKKLSEEKERVGKEKALAKSLKHSESQTTDTSDETRKQVLRNISEEINNMITTDIPEKFYENGRENASGIETVAAIEKMLSHTMSRVESSECKIRDLLKELRNKDNEVQDIEEENKSLRFKIEELKEQCENLPTISENNEDVDAMESKITDLENEVSILREVRSNLEVEHSNSTTEIQSLIRRLQTSEAMIRNQDNLQTEILKYKENENELLKTIKDLENSKEEISLRMTHLQHTIEDQDKLIVDLKQSNLKLEEVMHLNDLLEVEITKSKEKDVLCLKLTEELEQEKSQRIYVEEEKEKLFAELTNLKNSEEKSLIQNIELQKECSIRIQLEKENSQLQKEIISLQEAYNKHDKLIETLQHELSAKDKLEDALDLMRTEIKLLEEKEIHLIQEYQQQNIESDMKIKEMKALNSHLTQKCVKCEKQVFDLTEQLDGLKIETGSKDRKLCEMILEKSVFDKELEEIKRMKEDLEKQLYDLQVEHSVKEEDFYNQLTAMLGRCLEGELCTESNVPENKLHIFIKEITQKLSYLKQEKNLLEESVRRLTTDVCDKSECIQKLTAQLDTLQAEKHSIEDRLRNLKETVSTANQTEQLISPENSKESYAKVHKDLEDAEVKVQELEGRYNKLLNSSEQSLNHVNNQLQNLTSERQQLIEAVQTKHAECVKYHSEIQRLCAELSKAEQQKTVLKAQLQSQLEDKEEQLTIVQANSDRQVAALNEQMQTLQNQLDYVSQLLRVTDRQEAEGQPANDSPSSKTPSVKDEIDGKEARKVDELFESLQQEQLRNKYLQDEVSEQHEKEASLLRELERLRGHLVSVEDNYTQEMVRAEQQLQELNQRLAVAEDKAKSSSTAYTSASIRANQQVESLSSHLRLVSEQKDKISAQLAFAEDKLHKQQAALTNLQIVLEQFQRDKERDVAMENERIRQTLQQANNKIADLSNEIKTLQSQLKEAKEGLSAASRLTEQLDHKSKIISELKQEVAELTDKLKKADERIQAASVSVEGKVDRCLVRNLVVGYLCAPPSSRQQALGIIATVLDFSPDDRQKSGLDPSKYNGSKQQSLSEAFIRFLENESRPQPQLRMAVQETTEGSRSRKTSFSEVGLPRTRRTSGSVLRDVLKQDL